MTPHNLNVVLAKIKETWNVEVSKTTLKRILKSFSMSWRRLRRVLAGQPDPVEYETKRHQLEVLKCQEEKGELDLRYLDESVRHEARIVHGALAPTARRRVVNLSP